MKIRLIIICGFFAAIGLWWWGRSSLAVEKVADTPKVRIGQPAAPVTPVEPAGVSPNSPASRTTTAEATLPEKPDPRTELASAIKDMVARLEANDPVSMVENYDPHFASGEYIPPEMNYQQGQAKVVGNQRLNLLRVLQNISGKTPIFTRAGSQEVGEDIAVYDITDPVRGGAASFHLRKVNGRWTYDLNDLALWETETSRPDLFK